VPRHGWGEGREMDGPASSRLPLWAGWWEELRGGVGPGGKELRKDRRGCEGCRGRAGPTS
jgi:hypothetical protein